MTVMTSAPQITARENKVLQMPTELSLAVVLEVSDALRQLLADVFGLLRVPRRRRDCQFD